MTRHHPCSPPPLVSNPAVVSSFPEPAIELPSPTNHCCKPDRAHNPIRKRTVPTTTRTPSVWLPLPPPPLALPPYLVVVTLFCCCRRCRRCRVDIVLVVVSVCCCRHCVGASALLAVVTSTPLIPTPYRSYRSIDAIEFPKFDTCPYDDPTEEDTL